MSFSEDQVKAMVRKVLLRTLGPDGVQEGKDGGSVGGSPAARATITEADILKVPAGGRLSLPQDALVTPLARDTALERRVELVVGPDSPSLMVPLQREQTSSGPGAATKRTVAVGADHGGYALKEDLKSYLEDLGYDLVDCGTSSTASVDYPDFAYAVARLVAEGSAWRGIIVDGAGIGSCMAANKVPGVRAALCYDHATAVNSREHNDANVLTLGGVLVGRALAFQIARTWLETDFGGDRHARRVDKIMDIERRFLRR